ncbi:hypothetical protein N802_06785 [Knoellia sinensis KCTC 19936]|uniref:Uncharacterized protein n=1 Tax=Knoellia sinensis KCTC 19936 TaxID=1385520 RepID=A0A0A0J4J9_9MICO|nr:hypothetical protein [Knoellia sinensis]KGN30516.1 hypothetical protein N802_06785 [Knoellia sinensis KCTC 19936]
MRSGYLVMVVGLAVVKWPLLPSAHSLPLFEGVVLHPVKLLPVLLFESAWKLLWLGLVALPRAMSGPLDEATTELLIKNSLVVIILAVTPWRYVWRTYARRGDSHG